MVPGDLRLGRMVQPGDSGGRIAVKNLGGMMSLDPWWSRSSYRVCGLRLLVIWAMWMLDCRCMVVDSKKGIIYQKSTKLASP